MVRIHLPPSRSLVRTCLTLLLARTTPGACRDPLAARPGPEHHKPAGGVLLPKDLLKGGKGEANAELIPPETEESPTPRIVGRAPRKLLRRFSGKRVIPANDTWIEGSDDRKIFSD